jgi:hypothetical protein
MPAERRPRTKKPTQVEVPASAREELASWMTSQFARIQAEHEARVELLRTVGEHPSPIFSQMVRNFGGLGMPKNLAAKMLGMSVANFNSYYQDDYDLGAAQIISSVAANMIRIGTSMTDPNAAKVGMGILDRRGGEEWRPPAQKLEVNNKNNQPPLIDSSKLTYDERRVLEKMLSRVANGEEPVAEQEESEEPQPVIE